MANSEHMASKKEKVDSSEPPVASNAKSAMLMAAINKNAVSTGKGKTKAGAPSNASLLKKPEDKLLEKKQAGEKKTAVAKAAKVTEIEKPTKTSDGRVCFSLKKLRAIGNSVYIDLTEFDCPEDVQMFVSAFMSSSDKDRVKPNAPRPLSMVWNDKSMRLMTKEHNKAEKTPVSHEKATLSKETSGASGQGKDSKRQKEENATLWARGGADRAGGPAKSKAEMQREQFEAERAQILKEREEAKMANPDDFKDGLRVNASYHQESDDIMAELMASSEQNMQVEQKQAERELSGTAPPSAGSSLWDSIAAPDSLGSRLGNLGLGLSLGALSSLDSPERTGEQEEGDEGELGNLDDLIGSDFGALLGGLGSLDVDSMACEDQEPTQDGGLGSLSDLIDKPSSKGEDTGPETSSGAPMGTDASLIPTSNGAVASTMAQATQSPAEKAERERTVAETLHQMGQSSQAYQLQLRHLAVHYQHQTTRGGPVDPQLLQQIYTTKVNLQNLSAHYVHFMSLVNSGAPLPLSPMRQTAAEGPLPPAAVAAVPVPDTEKQIAGSDGASVPPSPGPLPGQQATEPSRPTGKPVNVNALFAAKNASDGTEAANKESEGTPTLPPQPKGRSVSVLSLFAAAAAAEKAESETGEPEPASSVNSSSTSTTISSDSAGAENKFTFHNAETKKKKKGGAMSAASKMKLLQMQKKKADSTK